MASTNHTQYYNLPQYIGTDKPTYLVDFNQAMASIDAGIHAAKSKADNNENNITTLTGTVGGLSTTVGQHTTSIGNLDTAVGGLSTAVGNITDLNTIDKSSVVNAVNEVNVKASNFLNFSSITNYETNQLTYTSCTARGGSGITFAVDQDYGYAKLYGYVSVNKTASGDFSITIPDTGFRPATAFTVNGGGFVVNCGTNYIPTSINPLAITFNTNGTVTLSGTVSVASQSGNYSFSKLFLMNSVIVLKDFSDVPQPE